jgi:hypothetical protein
MEGRIRCISNMDAIAFKMMFHGLCKSDDNILLIVHLLGNYQSSEETEWLVTPELILSFLLL